MSNKEQLVNNIKEWINYDNEIKKLQKKLKLEKKNKKR